MLKHAVILSGGFGRRFKTKTKSFPKSLVGVKGYKLIDFSLSQIKTIQNIAITVGPFKEEIMEHCFSLHKVETYIFTLNKGNYWWVFNSFFQEINHPVLVLPCDLITYIDLNFIEKEYKRLNNPPLMVIPIHHKSFHEGDYLKTNNNRVFSFSRKEKTDYFSSGIQVINPKKLNNILFNDKTEIEHCEQLWLKLIEKELMYHSQIYPHSWYSINSIPELDYYLKNHRKYYHL